jgi:hypothetical protein
MGQKMQADQSIPPSDAWARITRTAKLAIARGFSLLGGVLGTTRTMSS